MKQFILALLLLGLTITLTAVNAAAVRKDVAYLTSLAEQDETERLCEELERLDPFLSMTTHHALLEQAQQNANAMRAFKEIEKEDETASADYRMAKENLLLLLDEIDKGERCSFFNIF